jgi:hypothetical protein
MDTLGVDMIVCFALQFICERLNGRNLKVSTTSKRLRQAILSQPVFANVVSCGVGRHANYLSNVTYVHEWRVVLSGYQLTATPEVIFSQYVSSGREGTRNMRAIVIASKRCGCKYFS